MKSFISCAKSAVALTLLTFSFTAFAGQSKVSLRVDSHNDSTVYVAANGYYSPTIATGTKRTQIRGEGLLAVLNKDTVESESKPVLEHPGDFDRISFSKASDGRIIMSRSYRFSVPTDELGNKVTISDNANAEVNIISGTWNDYQNGEVIQVEMTEEASRIYLNCLRKKLEVAMESLRQQLGSDGTIGPINIDRLVVESSALLNLSKSALTMVGGDNSVQISFKANL